MALTERRVAVMQPYFFPYLGYFRLLSMVDVFVSLNDVQFPRRGYVHRNSLRDQNGNMQWLTLPLKKGPRDDTLITDLEFTEDAQAEMLRRSRQFPALDHLESRNPDLYNRLVGFTERPDQYLLSNLLFAAKALGIACPEIVRSSELGIPSTKRGEDRIIETARCMNATIYINAPGGVELYNQEKFAKAGLTLKFLTPYIGNFDSTLQRLLSEETDALASELHANSRTT